MVIWLRSARGGVGIGQEVLRAGDMDELVALDRACEETGRQAADLMAAARAEADAIRGAAQEEAGRMLEQARRACEQADERGYTAGLERALDQAQETMLRGATSEHKLLIAMQERLADIVMRTVARVLGDADRDALFTQVAASLSRHLDQASFLSVRVAPADFEAAARAFAGVCEGHRWPLNPTFEADPDAEPGSCACEWDHGVVVSGLPLQLRALERAIRSVASGGEQGAADADPDQDLDDEADHDADEDEDEDEASQASGWDGGMP